MAARLNLTLNEQKFLAMGAFLHDIGNTSLPAYRFSEDQILPSGEPIICKEHCERGARLASTLGLPKDVQDIITYHHERWDGYGYPSNLSGRDIPILARIVGIAQAFDHLTADALAEHVCLLKPPFNGFLSALAPISTRNFSMFFLKSRSNRSPRSPRWLPLLPPNLVLSSSNQFSRRRPGLCRHALPTEHPRDLPHDGHRLRNAPS
ncbi:MAG: HD domain-containing protein [Nitrospira sp.]|nr:HD domain-containing protein [Nitrospira sp.]